jgi:hypothetical protein
VLAETNVICSALPPSWPPAELLVVSDHTLPVLDHPASVPSSNEKGRAEPLVVVVRVGDASGRGGRVICVIVSVGFRVVTEALGVAATVAVGAAGAVVVGAILRVAVAAALGNGPPPKNSANLSLKACPCVVGAPLVLADGTRLSTRTGRHRRHQSRSSWITSMSTRE